MLRFVFILAGVGVCLAQTPADLFNKPPEDVDQALRARITEFYQDHVDGKFRQAEPLVAEDTKDFFYGSNKPKYLSFEISRIEYFDGYTRAKATVTVQEFVLIPGFTDKPLTVPTPSTWKLIDGKWYWYVDQATLNQTPFGTMKAGPGNGASSGQITIPSLQDLKLDTLVKADKQQLKLKPGGTDQVVLTNHAQGSISLSVLGAIPGVQVQLNHMDVKAGEQATLTFRASGSAQPGILSVRIDQTNQVIPIQVTVQ